MTMIILKFGQLLVLTSDVVAVLTSIRRLILEAPAHSSIIRLFGRPKMIPANIVSKKSLKSVFFCFLLYSQSSPVMQTSMRLVRLASKSARKDAKHPLKSKGITGI